MVVMIGTAGWAIPRQHAEFFPGEGSHLQRYARNLRAVYRRLHGAPKIYYSAYSAEYIDAIAAAMRAVPGAVQESWCIFDNTALGEATGNALSLSRKLSSQNQ